MTSTQILNEFISKIKLAGQEKAFRCEPRFGPRMGRNIFNIIYEKNCAITYSISMHVSMEDKPRWTIMVNTIDELQEEEKRWGKHWGIFLLHKSSSFGYFMSSSDVINNRQNWHVTSKEKYIVHLNDLTFYKKIYSLDTLINLLKK